MYWSVYIVNSYVTHTCVVKGVPRFFPFPAVHPNFAEAMELLEDRGKDVPKNRMISLGGHSRGLRRRERQESGRRVREKVWPRRFLVRHMSFVALLRSVSHKWVSGSASVFSRASSRYVALGFSARWEGECLKRTADFLPR